METGKKKKPTTETLQPLAQKSELLQPKLWHIPYENVKDKFKSMKAIFDLTFGLLFMKRLFFQGRTKCSNALSKRTSEQRKVPKFPL